ncbi:MAG: trigger factor, partial [Solobacterium sp.]|nr:trigger factor [Solobacterium sp.]
GSFIPGFEDQLIGAKAGEEKELNLTFPEDYHSEDLAGKAVVFKVKVNEVKHKVLPELDDDFAKDVNVPGVETVEQLREKVTERLENNKKAAAEQAADAKLYDELSKNAEIEIPQPMIDDEVTQMIQSFESQIRQYGMDPKQYYKMMGSTEETLRETYKDEAEKNVRLRLILGKIAEVEEITVSEEDVEAEIRNLAQMYGLEEAQVRAAVDETIVKKDLANQKASAFVKEHAAKA